MRKHLVDEIFDDCRDYTYSLEGLTFVGKITVGPILIIYNVCVILAIIFTHSLNRLIFK